VAGAPPPPSGIASHYDRQNEQLIPARALTILKNRAEKVAKA
jgi:hypothetical protein